MLDNKLLQLEKDCFEEQQQPIIEHNDKENTRLITHSGEIPLANGQDESDAILLKTLDGRVIKSVQAPGKGKPTVPFKVGVMLGVFSLVYSSSFYAITIC